MDKDIGLCLQTLNVASLKKVKKLQYFLKPGENVNVDITNVEGLIQYGLVSYLGAAICTFHALSHASPSLLLL
jgi:hypothetical protein